MSRANFGKDGEELMKNNVDDFGNLLYKVADDSLKVSADQVKKLEKLNIKKVAGESLKGVELTAEQLKDLGISMNAAADVLSKDGKKGILEVRSKSSTYIFEQLREILAGYGPVLLEFVGFLPQLFDPFGGITESLMGFRDKAQTFISGFNKNLDVIEEFSQKLAGSSSLDDQADGANLKKQSRGRAALSTVANFLQSIGGIDDALQKKVLGITQDVSKGGIAGFDKAIAKVVPKLLKGLLNSSLIKEFSKIGGLVIGGITKADYRYGQDGHWCS